MRNCIALSARNIETYVIRDFTRSKFQISVQLPEGFYESKDQWRFGLMPRICEGNRASKESEVANSRVLSIINFDDTSV